MYKIKKELSRDQVDVLLMLAGEAIECRDLNKTWIAQKDKDRLDIGKGIVYRNFAIRAYTKLRNIDDDIHKR